MKAHLIYSMVAVGMLFASCANEEPAPNMKADEGIQPVTRACLRPHSANLLLRWCISKSTTPILSTPVRTS